MYFHNAMPTMNHIWDMKKYSCITLFWAPWSHCIQVMLFIANNCVDKDGKNIHVTRCRFNYRLWQETKELGFFIILSTFLCIPFFHFTVAVDLRLSFRYISNTKPALLTLISTDLMMRKIILLHNHKGFFVARFCNVYHYRYLYCNSFSRCFCLKR